MVIGKQPKRPGDITDASHLDTGDSPFLQLKEATGELQTRHDTLRRLLDEAEQSQRRIEQAKRAWVSAFDAVPDPIFMHDREYRIVRANRAYAELAGLDFALLLGRLYWEAFPKHTGPSAACEHAMHTLAPDEEDIRLDSGQVFHSRVFPVRDAQGDYLYSIHILEDVTRQRRAESARQTLSEALRQAAEGIVLLDLDFHVRYANRALRLLLERRADEIVGRPLASLLAEAGPETMSQAMREHGQWAGDVVLHDAHGATFPAKLSLARVTDDGKQAVAYVGTITDLRRVRGAEASLHETEQRYRRLFDDLGEAACLIGAGGEIVDVNPRAGELLGKTRADLVGTAFERLYRADKAEDYRRLFAQRVVQGHTLEFPAELARPDGGALSVTVGMMPLLLGEKPQILVRLRAAPAPSKPAAPKPAAAPSPAARAPAPADVAIVQRMDGSVLTGNLRALDFEHAQAVVDQPREGEVKIPFQTLRSLTLPGPFPTPPAGTAGKAPPPPKAFRVQYVDGQELTGKAYAVTSDRYGMHLELANLDGSLRRVFVPAAAIKETFLPPPLGQALREAGTVSTVEVDTALDRQKALRTKRIGEYLQGAAAHSAEELRRVLARREKYPAGKLGEALLAAGLISPRQLEEALTAQHADRRRRLGDLLLEARATTPEALHAVLARTLGIPFVHLHEFDIDKAVLPLVTAELARKHMIMPLMQHDNRLVLAMEDPVNQETIHLLHFLTGLSLEAVVATREDILWAIGKYYQTSDREDETETLESLEDTGDSISVAGSEEQAFADAERLGRERPVVRLVNNIILEGIRRRASDIHLHPFRDHADLLYRIDGTLIKVRSFNIKLLPALVARIKIIARLDIAERRLPQDGAARALYEDRTVDLRISVIPTVDGESVVIRILNTETGLKVLSQLGFSSNDEMQFADLLHKSYGILLVTGPTGSGKSTTLYAALGEVIKQNVNIITVEDPVEYHIPGIEQIQVNTATGYTFAKALRSILRHDPDAILIGEIRDEETAKIAIQSALTGHLVLSSLHTNDAASSVTRLLEMGVEPYLLSATLLGVLAQRLVRRNCPHCLEVEEVDPLIRRVLGVAEDEVFYKGKGCEHCNGTGYSGRMAVYELQLLNNALRARIVPGVTAEEIRQLAVANGMATLTQNALAQARARKTSLIEVYRVRLE